MRRASPPPAVEEWDFSPIFDSRYEAELPWCREYEFRREKYKLLPGMFIKEVIEEDKKINPYWPDTPYLKIPQDKRRLMMRECPDMDGVWAYGIKRYTQEKHLYKAIICPETDWLEDRLFDGVFEVMPITIGWDRSNAELVKQFRTLLECIRPAHIDEVEAAKGKASWQAQFKADLKALGAFRILLAARTHKDKTYDKANRWTQQGHKGKALFEERTAWLAAEERAIKLLFPNGIPIRLRSILKAK